MSNRVGRWRKAKRRTNTSVQSIVCKFVALSVDIHVGGQRDMRRRYQDALCVCQNLGKPTYFITITCNPFWPDIANACAQSGQKYSDRPDIVTRVFSLKLKELQKDLYKRNILGKAIGYLDVIEYQKRGLSHAHILVILEPAEAMEVQENVDAVVCATFPIPPSRDEFGVGPDSEEQFQTAMSGYQRLDQLVCETMLHGEHVTGKESVGFNMSIVRVTLEFRMNTVCML